MNKKYAIEWLKKAYHHLTGAEILYNAEHFTDVIAFELQQAIEKLLKAFLAYYNEKIVKTHDLVFLYGLVKKYLDLSEDEIDQLDYATRFYIHERYPGVYSNLPDRDKIGKLLEFSKELFKDILKILNINEEELR